MLFLRMTCFDVDRLVPGRVHPTPGKMEPASEACHDIPFATPHGFTQSSAFALCRTES